MSEISAKIGANIREIRKIRNMTMTEVADAIERSFGEVLSAGIIGSWQRGQRRISADHLYMISHALGCSVYILYGITSDIRIEAGILSQHERQIVEYLFNDWTGDTHALIEFVGMYMASDRKTRQEMVEGCLYVYNREKKSGMLKSVDYDIRTDYIRQKCKELQK